MVWRVPHLQWAQKGLRKATRLLIGISFFRTCFTAGLVSEKLVWGRLSLSGWREVKIPYLSIVEKAFKTKHLLTYSGEILTSEKYLLQENTTGQAGTELPGGWGERGGRSSQCPTPLRHRRNDCACIDMGSDGTSVLLLDSFRRRAECISVDAAPWPSL